MADTLPTAVPLRLIESETDGYCDPVTGVCAVPGAASATPTCEAQSPDEPDAGSGLMSQASIDDPE
jgi:hypothetical protein